MKKVCLKHIKALVHIGSDKEADILGTPPQDSFAAWEKEVPMFLL
jgi:hypothetical protein